MLDQEDVGLRMAGAQHRHQVAARAVSALLQLAREGVQLSDRPLEVLLADLVVGDGHAWGNIGRAPRMSLLVHQDLRAARRTRRSFEAAARRSRNRSRLQELQRLHVQQGRRRAHDVRLAQRLHELLRPVEVGHADPHRAEPLRHVRVRAGARRDAVLGGEAGRLLVELLDRDARVEDLDRVDVVEHRHQVLVVGHRVHAVERVRDVDDAALALDLGDRLLQRQPARDQLSEEQADHLALVGGLDLLADDHLDPARLRLRLERAGDHVVVGHGDRAEPARLRGRQQHLDRRRAVGRVVGVHVQVDVDRAGAWRPSRAAPGRLGRRGAWRRGRRRRPPARRRRATI